MLPKNQPQISPIQWNSLVAQLPGSHILQTWEWGKIKSQFGWQPNYVVWVKEKNQTQILPFSALHRIKDKLPVAAALILQRNINVGGFSHRMGVMYVPKGPLLDWNDLPLRQQVLQDLKDQAQKHSAIFIKIDPDVELGSGLPGTEGAWENPMANELIKHLSESGWQFSDEQVQFRNTMLIDLNLNEDELLAQMKQKTRYNVNLAIRRGVTIRPGKASDISTLFRLYAETSIRDGFTIRNEAYYTEVWTTFLFNPEQPYFNQPHAEALLAEVDGEIVAAVIVFMFSGKAWYLYGMSGSRHREKMPNYLLQWEAIKRAKTAGCATYDLWGAPDQFTEADPMWGVYKFKDGLGGSVHRYLGAWDLPTNRMLYRLYSKTLPGLMDIMRIRGKANTRQVLS